MTDKRLKELVDTAVACDRTLAETKMRLDAIKGELKAEAISRPELRQPTGNNGWSVTLDGTDGCIARVTQEGPGLVSAIRDGDKKVGRLRDAAGAAFSSLFEVEQTFIPKADFRALAAAVLGTNGAARVIKLVQRAGRCVVGFETKKESVDG